MPIPQGIHSVVDLLDRAVAEGPDAAALADRAPGGYAGWTYAQLAAVVYRFARHLRQAGVEPGAHVGILMPSCRWWGASWLAILACDACAIPLDTRLQPREILHNARNAGLAYLVTTPEFEETADACTGAGLAPRGVLTIDHFECDEEAQFLVAHDHTRLPRRTLRTDAALIIYTSGTTGEPKGVVLSHGNLLADVFDLLEVLDVTPNERFVSILPLHHVYELLGGFVAPLALGASVTYTCSLRPDVIVRTMRDARATVMMVVPAFLRALYGRIEARLRDEGGSLAVWLHRLCTSATCVSLPLGRVVFAGLRRRLCPTLRGFICGGAPLSARLVRAFRGWGITVLQGYGLTETAPVIAVSTFTYHTPGSVGRPIDSLDVRVVRPPGEKNGCGELWVRGETVFRGYYNCPAATAAAFHGDWFRTGDLVSRNRRGELFIRGRVKNTIVTAGGKNIHPEEVEELLERSPAIAEACVVGMVDSNGEYPVAVVIPADEHARPDTLTPAGDAVRAAVRAALEETAQYKRPRRVFAVDSFPRTTTLKVRRTQVCDLIRAATGHHSD